MNSVNSKSQSPELELSSCITYMKAEWHIAYYVTQSLRRETRNDTRGRLSILANFGFTTFLFPMKTMIPTRVVVKTRQMLI
ncbi:hypothetical protein CPB86DRAFT_785656, partial [Serendipita vermifera]